MQKHQLLQILIDKYNYRSYLELGCYKNNTFNYISVDKKIGVDCRDGGTVRSTTDQFFDTNKIKYDLIFIDADHTHECSRRDLNNSLSCLNDDGCIVLHDTLPELPSHQNPRYNGTVWKTIVEYRSRKDLDIITANFDHGCTLIFKNTLGNSDTININNPSFDAFCDYKKSWMNIIEAQDLINRLPVKGNLRNISVASEANWGRIGHQFSDLLSGKIIATLFNIEHVNLGWTRDHKPLNSHLPVFKDSINYYPYNQTYKITLDTPLKDRSNGINLHSLRGYINSVPKHTNVLFGNSTFYGIHRLLLDEANHNILPGTTDVILGQLRSNIQPILRNKHSDCVRVVGFIRGGGLLNDLRDGCFAHWYHNYQLINTIKNDIKKNKFIFKWYSQGPIEQLQELGYNIKLIDGNYVIDMDDEYIHSLEICDDSYPELANIIIDFLSADIHITGYSSFSNMISILRFGSNYASSLNPITSRFDKIIDINSQIPYYM